MYSHIVIVFAVRLRVMLRKYSTEKERKISYVNAHSHHEPGIWCSARKWAPFGNVNSAGVNEGVEGHPGATKASQYLHYL